MIVETAVESYRFTCARCAARWTESYEVSQVTDDAGLTQSFYRHVGGPACEAPSGAGNVRCPNCGGTKVRKDPRYDEIPGSQAWFAGPALGVPEQRAAGDAPAARRRHAAAGTWHRFKFLAVVTLDPGGKAGRQYRSGAPGLLVRARSCQRPSVQQYFPAIFFTDDRRPLRPGDKGVSVTVCVPDDDASGFFQSGQRFTLWDGADIGHGTVAYRLFFGWPELG